MDADQWDPTLTMFIIKNLLKGGGDVHSLWKLTFLNLIPKVQEALLEISHMDKADQFAYMQKLKLLPTDIFQTCNGALSPNASRQGMAS